MLALGEYRKEEMEMFGAIWAAISGIAILVDGVKGWGKDINSVREARKRQSMGNNPYGTYYDYKGKERDLITKSIVIHDRDPKTGDEWLCDRHFRRLRNLSEEDRQRRIRNVIAKNDDIHTVINLYEKHRGQEMIWDRSLGCNVYKIFVNGQRYKDVRTGRVYVKRYFARHRRYNINSPYDKHASDHWPIHIKELNDDRLPEIFSGVFYMDVETGLLVRLCDEVLQKDKTDKEKSERLGRPYTPLNIEACKKFMEIFNNYQNEMRSKYRWTEFRMKERIPYDEYEEFNKFYLNYPGYEMI